MYFLTTLCSSRLYSQIFISGDAECKDTEKAKSWCHKLTKKQCKENWAKKDCPKTCVNCKCQNYWPNKWCKQKGKKMGYCKESIMKKGVTEKVWMQFMENCAKTCKNYKNCEK